MSARRIIGNVANGSVVTGSTTGYTATITRVSVSPANSVNNLIIAANSNFGFIYDITENL
jgi:hypothetical protein